MPKLDFLTVAKANLAEANAILPKTEINAMAAHFTTPAVVVSEFGMAPGSVWKAALDTKVKHMPVMEVVIDPLAEATVTQLLVALAQKGVTPTALVMDQSAVAMDDFGNAGLGTTKFKKIHVAGTMTLYIPPWHVNEVQLWDFGTNLYEGNFI